MNQNQLKKVKIVATLGPASDNKEMILKLAQAGVDVFRLNLSHRTREESEESFKNIRAAEKEVGRPLAIMGDLAGPKIRIGMVQPGVKLEPGQKIKIVSKAVEGNGDVISLNFPEILHNLEKGAEVYIADGTMKLVVEKKIDDGVLARVIIGGDLVSRKGFSAQGLTVSGFQLSDKDKKDIKDMIELGADALAVSFVQTREDIDSVLKLLPKSKDKRPIVIAKIETRAGVENAEDILRTADGLMVARGDLGLAVPMAELPFIQKSLINLGLGLAKPVITATQMLESMTYNHIPTRAEVTDVANAILDGTDAVMLSGETAAGNFPEEAVKMMASIIDRTVPEVLPREFSEIVEVTDAVSSSVVEIADQIGAKLIIALTDSGWTARRIVRHRHGQPVLALSPNITTVRRLNFSYGVSGKEVPMIGDTDELIKEARKVALDNPVVKLKKGEYFVISAGVPFGQSGSTNLALVQRV
ncbi:MAG TPA: pyruvate kinase [Candidatus Paceibacterota bacterium]|nr:pyruvate kinase [Candidatus Paceibacterota bacterium]